MKLTIIVLITSVIVLIGVITAEEDVYDEYDLIHELSESDDLPSGIEELVRVTRMAKNKKQKNRSKENNRSDEDMEKEKKRDANRNNNNNKNKNNKRNRKTNDDDDDDNSRETGKPQRVRSKRTPKRNKHSHERKNSRERNRKRNRNSGSGSGEKKRSECTFGGPSKNSQCCNDNIEKLSNKEKVKELANECMDELDDGDFCESREQNRDDLNCLMQCIGKKQGTIDDDGNINEEGLRDYVKNDMAASGWPRDKADQIVDKCLREVNGGSSKKSSTTTTTTTTTTTSTAAPSTTTVSTTPSTTPSTTTSTTTQSTTTASTTPSTTTVATTPSTTTTSTTTVATTPSTTTVATTPSTTTVATTPSTTTVATTSTTKTKTPKPKSDEENTDFDVRGLKRPFRTRQKRQSQTDNCRSTANKLTQCLWREFTLSCPRSKRNNTKMCQRVRAQISRNEPVQLFGPSFARKGGKHRSSEEKHRKH